MFLDENENKKKNSILCKKSHASYFSQTLSIQMSPLEPSNIVIYVVKMLINVTPNWLLVSLC